MKRALVTRTKQAGCLTAVARRERRKGWRFISPAFRGTHTPSKTRALQHETYILYILYEVRVLI